MTSQNPFLPTFRRLPLTLDRALEGRPLAAQNSRLLNLPVEILSEITKYIETDKPLLASLALVNSDCRQLARSCQFRDVLMDFGPRSSYIFGVLIREATERMRSKSGLTHRPSLGACIRYMETDLSHFRKESSAMRPEIPEGEEQNRVAALRHWSELTGYIQTRMDHVYDPSLLLVITTLPHLEFLNWTKSSTIIDPYLLDSLGASTVRHLRFQGSLDSDNVALRLANGTSWPLLSLEIEVRWEFSYRWEHDTLDASRFWNSLLQACCSTLRILKLHHIEVPSRRDLPITIDAYFPNLQFLYMDYDLVLGQPSLTSLLQSPRLSTLAVNFKDPISRNCMDLVGCLPSLETLIWNGYDLPVTVSVQSIESNSQLTKFGMLYSQPPALLERVVFALMSCSNLKTLSLVWDGTTIPRSTLTSLAQLTSLEELHISAGMQTGWRHDWFVDHDTIRNILYPLRKLKILAILRDSYQMNDSLLITEPDAYYEYRIPSADEYADFVEHQQLADDDRTLESMHDVWEKLHARRMTQQAEKYAAIFPDLQWLFIGQLGFTSQQFPDGRKEAVLSFPERKEDFPILETLFGIWSR